MTALPAWLEPVVSGAQRWSVVKGDSRTLMEDLPSRVVDHIFADPPYNKRTHERARSLKDGGSDIKIDFAHLTDFSFVPNQIRVAKAWVLDFCALEQLGDYARAAGERCWVRSGIWDRPDGTPQISGDRPGQAAEGIAVMHRHGPMMWNQGGKRGIWRHGVERNERWSETPKPESLMVELILDFTQPGDLVLDPYMGGGTTGVACLRTGRRFVGIELRKKTFEDARERLQAEEQGLTLSEARAGQLGLFGNSTKEAEQRLTANNV